MTAISIFLAVIAIASGLAIYHFLTNDSAGAISYQPEKPETNQPHQGDIDSEFIKEAANKMLLDGKTLGELSSADLLELYKRTGNFDRLHLLIQREYFRRIEFGSNSHPKQHNEIP